MQYKVKRTDSLTHHGILGMKWGKRNGPPYPLAPGDHSTSEKKAGWRKSLKKENTRKKARHTNPKTLTNEQMRSDINRIRLEREYRRESYSAGEKFIRDVGRNAAITITTGILVSQGQKYIKNKFGI